MFQGRSKTSTLFIVVAVLCLFMVTGSPLMRGWAAEEATLAPENPGPLNLGVLQGKLTGHFDDRPFAEILDLIQEALGFEIQASEQLLGQRLSGRFHDVPLVEAMEDILYPFDYVITFDASGKIKRLHIIGLRDSGPGTIALREAKNYKKNGRSGGLVTALPGVELTFEERLFFEDAAEPDFGPPPEMLDVFEPWQEPGTEATGPPVPSELDYGPPPEMLDVFEPRQEPGTEETGPPVPLELDYGPPPEMLDAFEPWQEPGTEETGPPVPLGYITEELPSFAPLQNERGPFAPDWVVEDLPEFEPVVSETGPSIEAIE